MESQELVISERGSTKVFSQQAIKAQTVCSVTVIGARKTNVPLRRLTTPSRCTRLSERTGIGKAAVFWKLRRSRKNTASRIRGRGIALRIPKIEEENRRAFSSALLDRLW